MLPIRELINKWSNYILIIGVAILGVIICLIFTKPFDPNDLIDMSEVIDKLKKEEAAKKAKELKEKKEHIARMRKTDKDFDSISKFIHEQHNDLKNSTKGWKECVDGWKQCDKSLDKLAGIVAKLDEKKYPGLGLDVMLYAIYDGGLPDEKESVE